MTEAEIIPEIPVCKLFNTLYPIFHSHSLLLICTYVLIFMVTLQKVKGETIWAW